MEMKEAIVALGALAQDTRMQVFRLLVRAGPSGLAAGEIARTLRIPANTLSTHLKSLVDGALVTGTRNGRSIIYSTNWNGMRELMNFLTENCCAGHPPPSIPMNASGRPTASEDT